MSPVYLLVVRVKSFPRGEFGKRFGFGQRLSCVCHACSCRCGEDYAIQSSSPVRRSGVRRFALKLRVETRASPAGGKFQTIDTNS